MRHLILSMFCVSAFAASNEVDILGFGVSKHFENNSKYDFNEWNPGLGLAVWHNFYNADETITNSVGGVVAEYKNSYYETTTITGGVFKTQFGKTEDPHVAIIIGLAHVTGYSDNQVINPLAAVSIGYSIVNVEFAYIPAEQTGNYAQPSTQTEKYTNTSASCIAAWVRIKVWEF